MEVGAIKFTVSYMIAGFIQYAVSVYLLIELKQVDVQTTDIHVLNLKQLCK